MQTSLDWASFIVAALAIVIGLSFLLWELGFRRMTVLPRCPNCRYDLTGVVSSRCPECGHELTARESPFVKRRARWPVALGALLLVAAVIPIGTIVSDSMFWWIPTRILILSGAQISSGSTRPIDITLQRRLYDGAVSRESYTVIANRGMRVDRHDTSRHWRARKRWPTGATIYAEWVDPLELGAPPSGVTRMLSVQPTDPDCGATFAYVVNDTFVPQPPNYAQVRYPDAWTDPAFAVAIARTDSDGADFVFKVIDYVSQFYKTPHDTILTLRASTVRLPVEVVARIDEAIYLVSCDDVDQQVERDLSVELVLDSKPFLTLELARPTSVEMMDLEVAVQVEIRHGDNVVASVSCRFGKRGVDGIAVATPVYLRGDVAALLSYRSGVPGWTIHVIGDPKLALRNYEATRAWDGRFVIPISDAFR